MAVYPGFTNRGPESLQRPRARRPAAGCYDTPGEATGSPTFLAAASSDSS